MSNKIVDDLIFNNQHEKAEEILIREYETARKKDDKYGMDAILGRLVFVCAADDPPNIARGRQFCVDRENNIRSAYNILQTALFEYYTAGDYGAAAAKLHDAKRNGEQEGDTRTTYSCLGLLGLALLEMGRTSEAAIALNEIEQMLHDKKPFVVGDETAFLESAHDKGVELESVRRLAAALAPICRDPDFKRRLTVLASK